MGFLKQQVEQQLSKRLGADVNFQKLDVSLLSGAVEATGMTIAGGPSEPLLSVARIKAEISIAKALKKEIVVKSLSIESPVLTIVRRADGTTNLPSGAKTKKIASKEVDDDDADGGSSWKIEATRVLLVDGSVHFQYLAAGALQGVAYSAERILGEVKMNNGGVDFTSIVEVLVRKDADARIGPVQLSARADGVTDLAQLPQASFTGTASVAEQHLTADFSASQIPPKDAKLTVKGSFPLSDAIAFLPGPWIKLIPIARQGILSLGLKAAYGATGVVISELKLQADDVRLPL